MEACEASGRTALYVHRNIPMCPLEEEVQARTLLWTVGSRAVSWNSMDCRTVQRVV